MSLKIIKEIVILLGIAILMAFAVNFISPKGIAIIGRWETSQGVISAKPKDFFINEGLEIDTPEKANQIYDGGTALFVDARDPESYAEGHIKGAVNLPAYQINKFIDQFIKKHPFSVHIITYCSGRECDDGHKLMQGLLEAGYYNINVFIDGYPAWLEKDFPVE